jgi:NitT/TauT family transport system permease protein
MADFDPLKRSKLHAGRDVGDWWTRAATLGVVVLMLALWQFLPKIPGAAERVKFLDPFFISSPTQVAGTLNGLLFGADGTPTIWSYLGQTLWSTMWGVVLGVVTGALFGLFCSNSELLSRIASPLITVMNATPRIALVPIFVIIFGPSTLSSVAVAVLVVFFVVFYNAYSGGRSVPPQVLENAALLGASSRQIMRNVRLPYVWVWTFAALPNAISFGLIAVITAEVLTGVIGVGRLLVQSISTADASLTFAVVVLLAAVGVVLVETTTRATRRYLHWWTPNQRGS